MDAHFKPILSDIPNLRIQIRKNITALKQSKNDINPIKGDIELIKHNIELNKINEQKVNQENMKYAKLYEEGMKQANPNRLNLQQQPNESSDDYIKRIQSIEDEKYDINIHGDKSALSNLRKLKAKLKELIRDPSLIENILKSFETDEIYKINKYFEVIKSKILKIFGCNNKTLTDNDIHDEISNILTAIESPTIETFEIKDTTTHIPAPGPLADPAVSGGPVEYSYLIGTK